MKQRIITALGLIGVALFAVFSGKLGVAILIIAFLLIGTYEIYDVKKSVYSPFMLLIMLAFVFIGGINIFNLPLEYYLALLIVVLFSVSIFNEWFNFDEISYTFLMISLVMVALRSIMLVLTYPTMVLLYIFVATFATDTFAYFGGYFFGKHKLIERISPKKTIEGSISGYVMSAIISILFAKFLLQGVVSMNFMIATSLLIPIFSQVGDLAFSITKRHFNLKDFGFVFPGHGGVLDRIDSVIFSLITFALVHGLFERLLWI